nr:hypothetical protein [Tanacetum cinerariifolium]
LELPKSGTGTVTGQVFLRTVGGDVKYGAGSPVLLLQETDYMQQFYLAWLGNKRAPEIDSRALSAGFKAQANGSGEFTFTNVPPGDYYVVSQVTWGAPTSYGLSNQGGSIMVRATVADESVTTVMVTKYRDAEQKAADTRKALEALEDAGLSIKPAMDKAGASLESVGKSATKAKKSIHEEREEIEQLLGSIDPLARKLNELEKQEAALNKARKSGKIELDTYTEYSNKIAATRAELARFNDSMGKTGISAKQTAAALRGVPAQFTDIATSLQGGQAPLTVFLQQGGQLKDMFGGAGPAAKALGGYVLGLINPFTVAAAAAGGLALAYKGGSDEATAFNQSLISTGNFAGATGSSLSAMAQSV